MQVKCVNIATTVTEYKLDTKSVTLQGLLDNWEDFSANIIASMISMFFYKYQRLKSTIDKMEHSQNEKFSSILSDWREYLEKLAADAKLEGPDPESTFFDNSQYWEILKDNYPEFFTTKIALQRLKLLYHEMTETKGDSKIASDAYTAVSPAISTRKTKNKRKSKSSLLIWAESNTNELKSAIEAAISRLKGRDRVLNEIAQTLQAFANRWSKFKTTYLNFIITGAAGSGKTTLAKHMSQIFQASGLIYRRQINVKKAHDFLGRYVGQSAPLTQSTLNDSIEKVLFIDEAYSLATCETQLENKGSKQICNKFQSYGQESIATMIDFLSEHRGQIIVIMAGYRDKMVQSVLAINEGVSRRFPNKWDLVNYTPEILMDIFNYHMTTKSTDPNILSKEAQELLLQTIGAHEPKLVFENQAGDMENLADLVSNYVAANSIRNIDLCTMGALIDRYLRETYSSTLILNKCSR